MMNLFNYLKSILTLATAMAFFSCGGDSSSDDPVGDIVTAIGGADAVNQLAEAYPHALSASVFPTGISADPTALALLQDDKSDEQKTSYDKLQETDRLLRGEADACFKPERFDDGMKTDVKCYQFDNDMNPFKRMINGQEETSGTVDGKHTNGEACLVAFTREEIGDAVKSIERALSLVAAMICQVKKNNGDTTPPAISEVKDYTADLEGAAGSKTPITKATMTRLEDIDGRAVYQTDIEFTDPRGIALTLNLAHSPGATADEDEGSLNLTGPLLPAGQAGGDPNNNEENMNHLLSIKYSGSIIDDKPRMRMRVARANLLKTITPFVAGEINYTGIEQNANNETANNLDLTEFDINPLTNEGTFAYWRNPGGTYNEAARGFIFAVEQQDDGTLKGCGVTGAVGVGTNGTSIRKYRTDPIEANILKPKNYWHPFANQNTATDKDPRYNEASGPVGQGEWFTEQCFIQNASSGLYEIDTSKLENADEKTPTVAAVRGYSVLPGSKIDQIGPANPEPPRDHQIKPN